MAPIVLYYFAPSAPCRVALNTIRYLNLDVEKEQLQDDFVKINPQHTVPTLNDDGFILSESRAIAIYLIEKYYPEGHSLYPNDVKTRALINQFLQFDCATLHLRIRAICWPALYLGQTHIDDENRTKLFEAIKLLDTFLDGKKYFAGGEQPTIADLSVLASMANLFELIADLNSYPNVVAWFESLKKLPSLAENFEGAKQFADKVKSILKENL